MSARPPLLRLKRGLTAPGREASGLSRLSGGKTESQSSSGKSSGPKALLTQDRDNRHGPALGKARVFWRGAARRQAGYAKRWDIPAPRGPG